MSDPATIISFDGTEIAYLSSGSIADRDRPLAICVHGFPDSPHTWRHLVPELESAGYRVVTPFLRGYAPSAVPDDGCVQTAASARDLMALRDELDGDERTVLIGHDWGAIIAYAAAAIAPDRWSRVVGMAVPPGSALGTALLTDTDQLKRSWYAFFFQTPLADLVVPADDLAFIDMIWSDWSPGLDASDDLPHVKDTLRDPAHLAAALGYYRAALSGIGLRDDLTDAQTAGQSIPTHPLLYLHGTADGCIGESVVDIAAAEVGDNVSIEKIDGAGHFVHLEQPDLVDQRIVEFLS